MKSPIVGAQLLLLDIEGLKPEGKEPYAIEINEVPDHKRRGATDITDVEYLLENVQLVAIIERVHRAFLHLRYAKKCLAFCFSQRFAPFVSFLFALSVPHFNSICNYLENR